MWSDERGADAADGTGPGRVASQTGTNLPFVNTTGVYPQQFGMVLTNEYGSSVRAKLSTGLLVVVDNNIAICTDEENAVWYADVPGKRCVRVAEGGEVLRTIELDRGGFACTIGGPSRSTLFIVAAQWQGMTEAEMVAPGSGQVLAVEIDVPGAGWP